MASHPGDRRTADRTTDELYRLLASEPRRDVLSSLAGSTTGSATVETLVDRLVESDADASANVGGPPDAETPDDARESVRAELLHVHLPKLDDGDLVEYDPDSGTVEYERAETAEALLCVTE